jgi:serine/threonine-protein phosphatase 2B regulatory subunit
MFYCKSSSNLTALHSISSSSSTLADLSQTEIEYDLLCERFNQLDKKKRGFLVESDFASLPELTANPLAHRITSQLFANSSTIDFSRFYEFMSIFSHKTRREDKLYFAFCIYDVDADNLIGSSDLYHILKALTGKSLDNSALIKFVDETIEEFDVDGDKHLNFYEFKRAMFDSDIESIFTIQLS